MQSVDGTWLHYASASDVGPKLGPICSSPGTTAGNTAEQILTLATGLQRTTQPGGTTIYTGTIPNNNGDPGFAPSDDELIQIIKDLRSGNEPGALGGYHDGLQLRMTLAADGLVQKIASPSNSRTPAQRQTTAPPPPPGPSPTAISAAPRRLPHPVPPRPRSPSRLRPPRPRRNGQRRTAPGP